MRYKRQHLRYSDSDNIISSLEKKSGCYRIYLSKYASINRLVKNDKTGLLYIGHTKESNGLLKRIRDFFDSATNRNSNNAPPETHKAGNFYQLHMQAHFGNAIDALEFEFEVTDSDINAQNIEVEQLRKYLLTYAELPPLNHQLPKTL